jgi:ectoine hydroxylase-related dioxygenase (phytanoyl-CoA dioxygenase family)
MKNNPYGNHKNIPGNPSTAKSSTIKLNDRSNNIPLKLLSEDDWNHWIKNGYIIIKNAISKKEACETSDFLWEFENKKKDDSSTWYTKERAEMKMKELAGTGMVEVYNNQYLWNNRQKKKIYNAFVDIWGTEKLWVTIDRANLNFPIKKGYKYDSFIHWDYDPDTKPQNIQGVLALSNQTDKNMGGFQCIPWLFRNYETWKKTQRKDRDKFQPDITGIEDKIVKVPLEAGDLLIFHSCQPHGIRPNLSKNKVRIAQYISMMPAEEENKSLKQWRINSWKKKIAPEGYAFPGDPRKLEKIKYKTAKLNSLGKKLLGINKW